MKTTLLSLLLIGCMQISAQSWTNIASDKNGDDHAFNTDAQSLNFRYSAGEDSIYIRLNHYNARGGDFGYAVALDTNLNPNDGAAAPQNNLVSGSPNLSMKYDLILYVYQNGFFPGVYVDTYDAQSGIWNANIMVDTSDQYSVTLGISLSDLGGKTEFNLIAFTGSFDIAPGGAGPSDVIPDSNYGEIRKSGIGQTEFQRQTGLFPVPAKDYFYLEYSGSIVLFDLQGKRLDSKEVAFNQPIPCGDLSPGVYLIATQQGIPLTKLIIGR